MNNFTKMESLPKAGHVNEVCKEWLVREDGALAYKLQSQEINEFYKGNRFRNAVVREDFPTALHEQIKEHEHAEKQTEAYRRRLCEQEEHDKRVAKEIANKLERDLQEQQQKDLIESEIIAQKMQEIYVNLPPVPPPTGRDKSKPPPPRPQKASTLQQQAHTNDLSSSTQSQPLSTQTATTNTASSSSSSSTSSNGSNRHHHANAELPNQLGFTSNTDGYVGLCLAPGALEQFTPQRARQTQLQQQQQQQPHTSHLLVSDDLPSPSATPTSSFGAASASASAVAFNQFMEHSKMGRSPILLNNDHFIADSQQQQQQQTQFMHSHHHHQHSASNASSGSSGSSARRNVFDFINVTQSPPQPSTNTPQTSSTSATRTPPTNNNTTPLTTTTHTHMNSFLHTPPSLPLATSVLASSHSVAAVEELIEYSDVADVMRSYDKSQTAGADTFDASSSSPLANMYKFTNHQHQQKIPTPTAGNFNRLRSPSNENLLKTDEHFQKLSPEKYDQIMGNDSGNGILSGAAAERHMQQHADDIELYVDPCDYTSLREIGLPMHEIKEMSKKIKQEQKDEILARRLQQMEAHDGLTQEQRDRLMAIEAQDKELAKMLQEREKAKAKRAKEKARLRKTQQKDGTTAATAWNGLHCGPLMSLPQDCMSAAKHLTTATKSTNNNKTNPQPQNEHPDLEAYSNPIDILHNQRMQNGTLTNGSLLNESTTSSTATAGTSRHNSTSSANASHCRDDDIYTLPVDSCRPGARPASLNIGPESGQVIALQQNNSMTRSENYSLDSQHEHQPTEHSDILPRLNYSKSSSFDQNSSPTPPYMPIQGTRRSHLGDDRKKKSKDKCTHQ